MENKIIQRFQRTALLKRSISVLVLAPAAIFVIYKGGVLYIICAALVALLVAFEWFKIVYQSQTIQRSAKRKWYALGAIYATAAAAAAMFLRDDSSIIGLILTSWLCSIVWVTDITAYIIGVIVGGPKILPLVSPSKTWSGLLGALICSIAINEALISLLASDDTMSILLLLSPFHDFNHYSILFLSAILSTSIISQIGDFLESAFKRHFNVKDSGNIIPGHGGIMDRVDGLFPVFIAWSLLKLWLSY